MIRKTSLLVLLAALAFALSPLVSSGFNGFAPDQFPVPQDNPPVQPAGYAFAIWGVIYLWLIAGAIYGVWDRATDPDWEPMRPALIVSLVIGAGWIPVAQLSPLWATVLIWAMLMTAVLALLRAGQADHLWLRAPIALYAGWLTAASSVALGLILAGYGYVDAQVAAYGGITLALVIALLVQALRPDAPAYSAAVIWALVGVLVANLDGPNWGVLALVILGIALLGWRAVVNWRV
ncbi:MAG: TspO/MBR family protein [Paracoccaceae bacterium]